MAMRTKYRGGRGYIHPAKRHVAPSVTTVLSAVWPSEALDRWKQVQPIEWILNHPEQYEQLFEHEDTKAAARVILSASEKAGRKSPALAYGNWVHAMVERSILDGEIPNDFPPPTHLGMDEYEIQRVKWQIQALFSELKMRNLTPVYTEAPVFGEINGEKWAGTIDIIAERDGSPVPVDVKTGKSIWVTHAVQLAAYALCNEYCPTLKDSNLRPLPESTGAVVAHMPRHSQDTFLYPVNLKVAAEAWMAALHLYHKTADDIGWAFDTSL